MTLYCRNSSTTGWPDVKPPATQTTTLVVTRGCLGYIKELGVGGRTPAMRWVKHHVNKRWWLTLLHGLATLNRMVSTCGRLDRGGGEPCAKTVSICSGLFVAVTIRRCNGGSVVVECFTVRTGDSMCAMEETPNVAELARSRYAVYRDKVRGTPPPPLRPCGTYAAARRHQRKKEPLCADCRAALNERQRTLYAKRKTK